MRIKSVSFTFIFKGVLAVLLTSQTIFAQTLPDVIVEAENGVRSGGVTVANTISGFSGTGYVTNFKTSADKITVTMHVSIGGYYKLMICYYSAAVKSQNIIINGNTPVNFIFPAASAFTNINAGKFLLNTGDNTIAIQSVGGYMQIDYFSLYSAQNHFNVAATLINPNANDDAKSLYAFLRSQFGVKIISGQTDDYYGNIQPIAGKTPLLRAFDFKSYSQGYPYLWDNGIGGHTFGIFDDGSVQRAIDWYNATNRKGIVNFHWHWHSPGGGVAGTNTFYSDQTTFDVRNAVVPGNTEYNEIIEDIDTIAYQLKRLQSAGVPVLWRPLHEAGGAWFWWGEKGSVACKKLYNILYDRLTNYHHLDNLIWIWSTPETDWYPGNDSVDMIGYDSYPGNYNYTTQKSMFDQLYTLTAGKKIIAMTENGPIPDIDACFSEEAPWAYFMSWSNLVTAQNATQHIIDMFNHADVLTIENPTEVNDFPVNNPNTYRIFPNPASQIVYIEGEAFSRLELYDVNGRRVFYTTEFVSSMHVESLNSGIYIVKIFHQGQVYIQKLFISR